MKVLQFTIFGISFVLQTCRILWAVRTYEYYRGTYLLTLCVTVIAGTSSFLQMIGYDGGLCTDTLGVQLNAVIWTEWMVCVPLLYFIAISIQDKVTLVNEEKYLLFGSFAMIFVGFSMNLTKIHWVGIFLLLFSILIFLYVTFLVMTINRYSNIQPSPTPRIGDFVFRSRSREDPTQNHKKYHLSIVLWCVMPTFPVAYTLASSNIIDSSVYVVVIAVLNVAAKVIFASVAMDAHLEVYHRGTQTLLQLRDQDVYTGLLCKNIASESMAPLQTILMSAENLSRNRTLDEDCQQAVGLIKESLSIIESNLRDIVVVYDQRNKEILMEMKPVIVREWLRALITSFSSSIVAKGLYLTVNVAPDVPHVILADSAKLGYVLTNLIQNSITYSNPPGNILVDVNSLNDLFRSRNPSDRNIMKLTFSVHDEGYGIPMSYLRRLFAGNNSALVPRDGPRQMGLGIPISQAIATGHGGYMSAESVLGRGSSFCVTIPFEVLVEEESPTSDESPLERGPPVSGDAEEHTGSVSVRRISSVIEFNETVQVNSTAAAAEAVERADAMDRNAVATDMEELRLFQRTDDSTATATSDHKIASAKVARRDFQSWELSVGVQKEDEDSKPSALPIQSAADTDCLFNVMLVDRSPPHGRMIAYVLKKCLCNLLSAADEAVSLIEQNPDHFDVALIDGINDVAISGIKLIKVFRSLGYSHLIIAYAEHVYDSQIEEFYAAGADLVLIKPISVVQLQGLVAYMEANGIDSRPSMRLCFVGETLEWVQR